MGGQLEGQGSTAGGQLINVSKYSLLITFFVEINNTRQLKLKKINKLNNNLQSTLTGLDFWRGAWGAVEEWGAVSVLEKQQLVERKKKEILLI